ncbi:MAG: NADH-quinone oxidoreductase subunit F, partial [Aquificota bacterium]
MRRLESREDLERLREEALSRQPERFISLGMGTASRAHGAEVVYFALKEEVAKRGLDIPIKATGDHGLCGYAPVMVVYPEGVLYHSVKAQDVPEVVDAVGKGEIVERLLYTDPMTGKTYTYEQDIPFYKKQMRLVLGPMESVEPLSIEDYLCCGGFSALAKALFDMKPEEIIQEVITSGLRGRGGAGFRTGWKWEDAAMRPDPVKYIICNGDEGDPGAYMDRCLLEGLPYEVLEGMIIGAYAVGAHEGFVYVRKEYPLATRNVQEAINTLRELGLLGENILGSGFDFDIQVVRGGGAFVCGESSALIASVEGRVGEPRSKHVHATESGLWGKPTVLNNVETLANVPFIVNKGGEWFASIGTEESKGTKVFSLAGDIYNTGLVEVPMGITLREVVYD